MVKEVTLDVTSKNKALNFVENYILWEIDKVDSVIDNTFFKTYMIVDVKQKPIKFVVYWSIKVLEFNWEASWIWFFIPNGRRMDCGIAQIK